MLPIVALAIVAFVLLLLAARQYGRDRLGLALLLGFVALLPLGYGIELLRVYAAA
ncbi:TPA: hypothetical protein ACOECD_003394 [Stenotrophomonas maltophilia]